MADYFKMADKHKNGGQKSKSYCKRLNLTLLTFIISTKSYYCR